MQQPPTTYREAFSFLKGTAEGMRNQEDPDIDELVVKVTDSVAAFKLCHKRINAVEAAIKEAIDAAGVEGGVTGA